MSDRSYNDLKGDLNRWLYYNALRRLKSMTIFCENDLINAANIRNEIKLLILFSLERKDVLLTN